MTNFRQNIKEAVSYLTEYEAAYNSLEFSERFVFALYFQKLKNNHSKQTLYYDSIIDSYKSFDKKLSIKSCWEDVKEIDLIYNKCHFTYVAKEKPYVEVSITSLFKDKITASENIKRYIKNSIEPLNDIVLLNEELNEQSTENLLTQYTSAIDLVVLALLLKDDAINMLCVKLINSNKNLLKDMILLDKNEVVEFINQNTESNLNKTQKETLINTVNKLFFKKELIDKFNFILDLENKLSDSKTISTRKMKI